MSSRGWMVASLAIAACVAACGSNVATGGTGGGGGDPVCSAFAPTPGVPIDPVVVTVRNDTAATIFLGAPNSPCKTPPVYRAEDVGGAPAVLSLGACELSCGQLQSVGCACAADCAIPEVIVVLPGGTYTTEWPRKVFQPVAMPSSCYADASCAEESCPGEFVADTLLRFYVDAYPAAGCTEPDCGCPPSLENWCSTSGMVSGAPVSVSLDWTPDQDVLDFVFQ